MLTKQLIARLNAGKAVAHTCASAHRARRCNLISGCFFLVLLTAAALPIISACDRAVAVPLAAYNGTEDEIDSSIKPGDDFYRYANGNWLRTAVIPTGQESFDTRAILKKRTDQRVRDLIRDAASSGALKGTLAQKVGDYYASTMDQAAIDAKWLTPVAAEMARIAAISNKKALSAYLGTTLNGEVDGLIANSDHVFGVWINQGFEDSDHNYPHLWQGGLGLPSRDDYLDPSPKMADLRAKYQAHIAAILNIIGIPDAETRTERVLALETKIARAFAPDSDAADVFKQNNLWRRVDFGTKAPGMDWDSYFESAGLGGQAGFIVWQPSAVTGVSALVPSEDIDAWKDYLRFHLIEHYAGVLPKTVSDEHFEFYGKVLSGAQQAPDREDAAIAATNGALGMAVGQLYTQRYFPPEVKATAQAMARNLITAYRTRISNLTWMSPETKEKALAKLAAFEIYVGYPDQWIDYSTLEIVCGDAFGNMRRAEAFLRLQTLAKLRQPVDPIEWPIYPQTPGAVIMFSPNAEFFSAALLQAPFFDAQGDAASNYGSAGAGMAHEISHSFDELGNIYDAHGRLQSWWTVEDKAQYQAMAAKLAAQFDAYCPLPHTCVNGKQVLGENIADLAGLLVAHDAYIMSLKGKPDAVIGGLTGERRFFLAFAHRWRKIQTEAALRKQIATDTHAPAEYRSDAVRNVDEWYEVYKVGPNDKLYVKPEDRVRIW